MSISHAVGSRTVLTLALLALGFTLGCASSALQREEQALAKRKAKSHFDLAVDHHDNGRVEAALHELLVAQRYGPDNPRILHGLAITYAKKERYGEAQRYFQRSLEIRPDYHEARINLSSLYIVTANWQGCARQSEILIDDPTYAQVWRAYANWGWAEYRMGNVTRSRELLNKALKLRPHYWPARLNLGILEAEQGHKQEAIAEFARILKRIRDPGAVAEVNYRLAEIFVSLGRRKDAIGHLRTAVVKAPGNPWGEKSEEYLKLLR